MTDITAITDLWARRAVVGYYERCAALPHNAHWTFREHGHLSSKLMGMVQPIPPVDAITIVTIDVDQGEGADPNCTWDTAEPATIEIAYQLDGDPKVRIANIDLDIPELFRSIVAAVEEVQQ